MQAKKESLVVVEKHDLRTIYNGKSDPSVNISLFKSSNEKCQCMEPEPPFFAYSWSRLRDLGTSGAAQKKWRLRNTGHFPQIFPAWIRIRILNADPDPQPWNKVTLKCIQKFQKTEDSQVVGVYCRQRRERLGGQMFGRRMGGGGGADPFSY